MDIKVGVTPLFNTGLLWSNTHLFAISDGCIQQIDASTGSVVLQWSLPGSDHHSCIALPKFGEFIAYSMRCAITFWDMSHTKLGHIQHSQDIRSIALSPDDDFIAIGGELGNIIVRRLPRIIVSVLCLWIMAYYERLFRPNHSILLSFLHSRNQKF